MKKTYLCLNCNKTIEIDEDNPYCNTYCCPKPYRVERETE